MNFKKELLILGALLLYSLYISAQAKRESLTVVPVTYLDTAIKPTIIQENPVQKSANSQSEMRYEATSAVPQANLSIGKASAVYTTVKTNKNAVESDSLQYHEQNIHLEETPVNNSSVQPK